MSQASENKKKKTQQTNSLFIVNSEHELGWEKYFNIRQFYTHHSL